MKLVFVLGLLFFVLLALGMMASKLKSKKSSFIGTIKKRNLLTLNEQPMYFRLVEAFPEHVVLAQVAFSALITTKDAATRNRFARKVADFVICTKAFEVIGVIELDDSSHIGREREDKARENLLTSAGYEVFRYRKIPNANSIRDELIAVH